MRLLFLPYKPTRDSLDSAEASDISPQKHAAREHHRKVKLLKKATGNKTKLKASKSGIEAATKGNGGSSTAAGDEGTYPGPLTVLGAGRVDPFGVYCASDQSMIVHEMVDHGKSTLSDRESQR